MVSYVVGDFRTRYLLEWYLIDWDLLVWDLKVRDLLSCNRFPIGANTNLILFLEPKSSKGFATKPGRCVLLIVWHAVIMYFPECFDNFCLCSRI